MYNTIQALFIQAMQPLLLPAGSARVFQHTNASENMLACQSQSRIRSLHLSSFRKRLSRAGCLHE